MMGLWMIAGLAGLGMFALAAVLRRRHRRMAAGRSLVEFEIPLTTLRAIVAGMEVSASSLVRGATVECFGDYRRDPGLLVVEVQTSTEAEANRMIEEGGLTARLRELLLANAYPAAAVGQVGLTIRSRERLSREAAALREQADLARWAED